MTVSDTTADRAALAEFLARPSDRVAEWWCKMRHRRTMWPMHGRYACWECGRVYSVPWEAKLQNHTPASNTPKRARTRVARWIAA